MERVLPPSALGGREHVFLFYSPTSAMKSIMSESHNLYLNTCYTEVYMYIYTHKNVYIHVYIYTYTHSRYTFAGGTQIHRFMCR